MVVDATNYKLVNTKRRIFSCVEPLRLLCIVGGEFESRQSGGEAGHARSYTSFTIRLCCMNEANSSSRTSRVLLPCRRCFVDAIVPGTSTLNRILPLARISSFLFKRRSEYLF
jgi:hypothetical protein